MIRGLACDESQSHAVAPSSALLSTPAFQVAGSFEADNRQTGMPPAPSTSQLPAVARNWGSELHESSQLADHRSSTHSIDSALIREYASDPSRHTSKYLGVRKRSWGRWVCEIRLPSSPATKNKRARIWLGSYWCPEAAARAYDTAAYHLRCSTESLNFPHHIPPLPRSLSPTSIKEAAMAEGARCDHLLRSHFSAVMSSSSQPSSISAAPLHIKPVDSPSIERCLAPSSSSPKRMLSDYESFVQEDGCYLAAAEGVLLTATRDKSCYSSTSAQGTLHEAGHARTGQPTYKSADKISSSPHSIDQESSSVHSMVEDEDEAALWEHFLRTA